MKTLTEQYRLIKEDKGHKGVFLKEAKAKYPHLLKNNSTFKEATTILKQKNIISENYVDLQPINKPFIREKEGYEKAFEKFLSEAEVKAEEKKVSKEVEEDAEKNYDYKDKEDPNNMIFGQIQMGYYYEMKQEKNADKTIDEIKDIVFKNLAKDPIYYTKNGMFGVDVGYTDDNVALGEPVEAKGEYKSSGYGNLKENKILKESINESEELSTDEASALAVKSIDRMEDSKGLKNIADKISKDPKASKQLMMMLSKMNLNLNENEVDVDPMDAKRIALAFAKKAEKDAKVDESNVGGAAALGLFGGGFLAQHLAGLNDVITPIMKATGGSPSHMGAALLGAATGAALLVLGKMVYDKSKNESYSPINEIAIAGGLVMGGGFTSANYMDFYGLHEESPQIPNKKDVKATTDELKDMNTTLEKTKELVGEDELKENFENEMADALATQAEEILRDAEARGEDLDIDKVLDMVMGSMRDLLKQHLEIFVRDLM